MRSKGTYFQGQFLRQHQLELGQSPGAIPYDHQFEYEFQSDVSNLSDNEEENSLDPKIGKHENEIDEVALSFDLSFLKAQQNTWKKYSCSPQNVTEAALCGLENAPPRPNSLDLKELSFDGSGNKSKRTISGIPKSCSPSYSDNVTNIESSPATPCVVVTETESNSDVATSYETIDEVFLPPSNRLLGVKSDSSGSCEGGQTWHDLSSSSPSSDLEVRHPTPLSSPTSPTISNPFPVASSNLSNKLYCALGTLPFKTLCTNSKSPSVSLTS